MDGILDETDYVSQFMSLPVEIQGALLHIASAAADLDEREERAMMLDLKSLTKPHPGRATAFFLDQCRSVLTTQQLLRGLPGSTSSAP